MAIQYDNRLHRYRDSATGRLVAFEDVVSVVEAEVTTAERNLERLTKQMLKGELSVDQWQKASAERIRDTSVRVGLVASGGRKQTTQQNYGAIGAELRQQYTFLHDFGVEIEQGLVSDKQALNRIRQYGRNTRATFYKIEFQRRAKVGYLVKRILDPQSEHCASCIFHQQLNFTSIVNVTPIGVDCECRSRCRCRLIFKKQ